jgi:hypothetical protein
MDGVMEPNTIKDKNKAQMNVHRSGLTLSNASLRKRVTRAKG